MFLYNIDNHEVWLQTCVGLLGVPIFFGANDLNAGKPSGIADKMSMKYPADWYGSWDQMPVHKSPEALNNKTIHDVNNIYML